MIKNMRNRLIITGLFGFLAILGIIFLKTQPNFFQEWFAYNPVIGICIVAPVIIMPFAFVGCLVSIIIEKGNHKTK